MSYTPDNQLLNPSTETIIGGIDEFTAAVRERVSAGTSEWKERHLLDITELSNRLFTLRTELTILMGDTA